MEPMLLVPIALPTLAGIACLILPARSRRLRQIISLIAAAMTMGIAGTLLTAGELRFTALWLTMSPGLPVEFDLLANPFSSFVLLAVSVFTLLVGIYSLTALADQPREREYYAYLTLTLGMASGAALANNLIVFFIFWDILLILLYALVSIGGQDAIPGANKTFILIGAADLALLAGIILILSASGTLTISEIAARPLALSGWLPVAAFTLLMIGAFAKAGAMPLHSWIPAISTAAPIPVLAYLPAALDKLLGIYLLARLSLNLFVMTPAAGQILMALGAITIVCAVLMALVQHDYRKMLAFHAVSQVGYMILGIGTGTPVGVIGGLFHLLNNAIYKSCLFLCGGAVERQTGRREYSELGGLAGAMPWTFGAALIAALAISGVPPLNGFVSKWLIYQGILERGGLLFPLFLLAAMFGSALTLASFMKLLYSMFLGDRPEGLERVTESSWSMRIPMLALSALCLVFGIFYSLPVNLLIRPSLGSWGLQAVIPGLWQSGLATLLVILSLAIGFVFYLVSQTGRRVERDVFLGGEVLDHELYRVPGTQLYGPIKGFPGLKQLFELAGRGAFDLYGYLVGSVTWMASVLYQTLDQGLQSLYKELIPALLDLCGQILQILNGRLLLMYLLWAAYAGGIAALLWLPGQDQVLAAVRVIALAGIFGWGILALVENSLRRLVAFAITSQMGVVLLAATVSWSVALTYCVSAVVALAALLACCASICQTSQTSDMNALDGLAERMPGRFLIFLVAAFWLSGLPPFGNFFAKYLFGVAAPGGSPVLPLAITAAAVLTLGYFLRPLRHFLHSGG